MTNTVEISHDDIRELAHTYYLYRDALGSLDRSRNHAGVSIYGEWLLSMQARMGVELVEPMTIRCAIATANQNIDAVIDA